MEHDYPITDEIIFFDPPPETVSYDPAVPYAYNRVEIQTASGSTGTNLNATTLPVRDTLTYDASPFVSVNESAIRTEAIARVDNYGHYVPDRVRLTLIGAFYGYVPGDVVRLTSDQVRARFVSTQSGIEDRACLISEVSENPIEGITAISLLVYPLRTEDDPL